MSDALYAALSGAIAQETALGLLSDNLANVNTVGFKRAEASFGSALATVLASPGKTPYPASIHVDAGNSYTDFSQGAIRDTGNPFDVALAGPGFFVVQTPNGDRLTRDGSFTLSRDGILRDHNGFAVQGIQGGPLRLPTTTATARFEEDGSLQIDGIIVDRLRTVAMPSPQTLQRQGNNLWATSEALNNMAIPLHRQALEMSNVNAIHTMANLIDIQRAYESYHRAMETVRAMEQKTTNNLG